MTGSGRSLEITIKIPASGFDRAIVRGLRLLIDTPSGFAAQVRGKRRDLYGEQAFFITDGL